MFDKKNYRKNYYKRNKNRINELQKEYYKRNRKTKIEYYKRNRKAITEYNKEYYKRNRKAKIEYRKNYYERNRKAIIDHQKNYISNRLKTDELFKFQHNIRRLIRDSFKRRGYTKSSKTREILCCDFEPALNYLITKAKQRYKNFKPDDFLKFNKYQIDHIIPLSMAKSESEVEKLCHISNLQLLTADDNLKKSNHTSTNLLEIIEL